MITLTHYLMLAGLLFAIAVAGIFLNRKNVILLLMCIDHTGAYVFTDQLWIRSIGRGSAPIFLFLAGYAASYRFSREVFFLCVLMLASNFAQGFVGALPILVNILLCRALFAWIQRSGKAIEKPLEWFIATVIFVPVTMFVLQYGTLGLLFAISGYMKRRPEHYTAQTQQWFLIASCIVYIATNAVFMDMGWFEVAPMLPVLCFDYALIRKLEVRDITTGSMPQWLVKGLELSSHYSAYIYAGHLIALSWWTHYPI